MSHFAKVINGIVTNVIVAEPEFFDTFIDDSHGQWIKTSYNMRGGVYYTNGTKIPAEDQSVIEGDEARMRKNYAGIGYTYNKIKDIFIPLQPYASWTLNETSGTWEPPVPYPDVAVSESPERYSWNEDTQEWGLEQ